jgi:hypothetical protein
VIAVQVGEPARYRARLRRDDLRDRDGMCAVAQPGKHGVRIRERIDHHHSLSLRRDLNARPAKPSDLHCRLLSIVDMRAGRAVQAGARVATGPLVRTRSAGDLAAA